jgi:hypothetical protein
MQINRGFAVALATALAGAAIGCGAGDSGEPAKEKSVQWSCGMQDSSRVVCSTAQASTIAPAPAFACSPGDSSAQCPDEATVQSVPGLADAVAQSDGEAEFDKSPWACLVTGKDEVQCTRSCGKPSSGGAAAGPADSSGSSDSADDEVGPPDLPTSCAPTDWEPYFAQLASYQYQSNGIDILFPRDIFDTSQTIVDAPPLLGGTLEGTEISCHTAEWAMRAQAWLDAVSVGCVNLAEPILVLCQQAADYAPSTGKCTATGTW